MSVYVKVNRLNVDVSVVYVTHRQTHSFGQAGWQEMQDMLIYSIHIFYEVVLWQPFFELSWNAHRGFAR